MNKDSDTLKPVIKEIVRANVCFADIKLLVDKINIVQLPTVEADETPEAYLLFLTDGEITIQALIKRRLHKYINRHEIREGSYVILKDYKLASADRLNGQGEVRYFAILDFYSVGEDERFDVKRRESVPSSPNRRSHGEKRKRSAKSDDEGAQADDEDVPRRIAKSTCNEAARQDIAKISDGSRLYPNPRPKSPVQNNIHAPNDTGTKLFSRTVPHPILRPLRLSTLASVTGPNASRNKTIDVLAIVHSVDDHTIKRKDIPLYRDIRITDPSTERIVTLSVFIDPARFVPKVGIVALFRSVTTHEYKGGKLNAYPQHCEGKQWYIPSPVRIEGCENEVKAMEAFKRQYNSRKIT